MGNEIKLLDTTLRDGSYAINFQFSCLDLELIVTELEEIGFEYIEIGHGVGLGASMKGHGRALQTDEEYLSTAQRCINKSKFGMFCIPGVAELDDINLANKYHMSFVRVGTNVEDVERSEPFIKKAKACGMMVMANYMKSYAAGPQEFAEKVKLSQKYGADVIYIVDSAGGMFPEDIKKYYDAIREYSDIDIGFHAHNNLGLAVSNSIYAAELGIKYIDCSLQGLGRSAGNAITELLALSLNKKGYEIGIDAKKTLYAGKKLIKPLLKNVGINPLDVVCGIAEFHTSYMKSIHKISTMFKVNPLDLIIEYSKVDKVNMDENRLKEIAVKLPEDFVSISEYNFADYIGNEQIECNSIKK